MAAVDFGSAVQVCLVRGWVSLFAVPPGAAAVQVVSDVGGADDWHAPKYSTFILYRIPENHSINKERVWPKTEVVS